MKNNESENKIKAVKKAGVIRKGAVVPFLVFSCLLIAFNIFFLDSVIKSTGEFFGKKFNGSEVNIESVETSFSELKFEIKGIQVSDPDNLEFNRVVIGSVKFQLLWDALLRAKFVVKESLITKIKINQKRKSKASLLKEEKGGQVVTDAAKKALGEAREEFKGNIFGDLSAVLSGVDSKSQMKIVEGELESKRRYNEIKSEVDKKENEWKVLMKSLPKDNEMKMLSKRAKAINFKDLGNFKKAAKVLKEIKTVKNEAKKHIKSYKSASSKFKEDTRYLKSSIKEADDLIKKDVANLQKRMKIPSIDAQSISRVMFGKEFADKVIQAQKYFEMAEEYMPKKKKGEKKIAVQIKRQGGRNYQFGTPATYPLFWLKIAKIDSENEQGNIKGIIKDATSDQVSLNKATVIDIKGDFPVSGIRGLNANIVIDHRVEMNDIAEIKIDSYEVGKKELSNSSDIKFNIEKASSEIVFKAQVKEKGVKFKLNNTLTRVQYGVDAKSSRMKSILNNVAKQTPKIKVDASAIGTWSDLSWKIKTNLAQSLNKGLRSHVQGKIDSLKGKLEAQVKSKVSMDKNSLNNRVSSLSDKYLSKLTKGQSSADGVVSGVDKGSKSNKPKDKIKRKALKGLDKLKKKFKF